METHNNTSAYPRQYPIVLAREDTPAYNLGMKKTPGEILQELMDKHGHNAYDLQRLSGVNQPTIHRILSGESKDPRTDNLRRLAAVYGLQAAHLRGEIPIDMLSMKNPVKLALLNYINEIDDDKLSPDIITILKEIIEAGRAQLPLIQNLVHVAWEQRAEYKVTENPSKRESNGK